MNGSKEEKGIGDRKIEEEKRKGAERHDPLYLMFDNDFHLGKLTPIGGSLDSQSYITIIYFHISLKILSFLNYINIS